MYKVFFGTVLLVLLDYGRDDSNRITCTEVRVCLPGEVVEEHELQSSILLTGDDCVMVFSVFEGRPRYFTVKGEMVTIPQRILAAAIA
jgi:hypothetical protein